MERLLSWTVMTSPLRALAFYLPQFHPIPENDAWWGKGFTEWTNVAKGRPLFPGHEQPHLPGELGFYDLRLPEVRAAQAALAREHGVDGFVYYHYWFGGRRLLERPFQEVLDSGDPDLPFALCWANENWTRVWDGGDHHVLAAQEHSPEDDLAHVRHLARAFADPRYVRVEGRPLFLVYRASLLPDIRRTTETWRHEATRLGVGEPYLVRVNSFAEAAAGPPAQQGFDAELDWIPDWSRFSRQLYTSRRERRRHPGVRGQHVVPYEEVVAAALADYEARHDGGLPLVVPMWDNTARRSVEAVVFHGSTPELYGRWLDAACVRARAAAEPLVLLNAWNEWAEGNHLEPDLRWGRAYLQVTSEVLARHR